MSGVRWPFSTARHRSASRLYREKCPDRVRENNARYREKNWPRIYERNKAWVERNRECQREHRRKSYQRHREKELAQSKEYHAQNPAGARRWREWKRKWLASNAEKHRAIQATRRAKKLMATPQWVDKKQIEVVYALARRLERETGVPHHVDHIVPLKHPLVCGLHVPWNLQVLTKSDNCRKGNKMTALPIVGAGRAA